MTRPTCWPRPEEIAQARPRRSRAVTAPAIDAGPRRALYLDGRAEPIEVRALGPALGIERGVRRFSLPLARLARIVTCGRVHWDSAALALCLHHGLPVVFLDGRGRPLGATAPLNSRSSTLDELLAACLESRHWREVYGNWMRAQRYRLLRHWARDRAQRGSPVDRAAWHEAVRSFVYVAERDFAGPNPGGCYAQVVSQLLSAGVRLQYRAADGGTLELATDLAHLADRRASLELGSLAPALAADPAIAAGAAESGAAGLEEYVVGLLARLCRALADWVEPWP